MAIETVTLSFSSADELMIAEKIADKLLTSEQLESLETGTMYPGNVYYMQIHEPIEYSEFVKFHDMIIRNEQKVCCICGKKFTGYGNSPWPVKEDGRCCTKCNYNAVIPARLKQLKNK